MSTAETIIAEAARLLSASGLVPPGVLILAMVVLAVLLVLAPPVGEALWKAIKSIKIGPAPSPISDGGTAADRDNPPAQPDPNATPPKNGDSG